MSLVPHVDSFADLLRLRVAEAPERLFARYLVQGDPDGQLDELTFGGLDRAARRIGAVLNVRRGDRVLLLFPPGLRFVEAFCACLYAGAVAVPVAPPDLGKHERTLPKLAGIIRNSGARIVLTTEALLPTGLALANHAPDLDLQWIASDAPATAADGWEPMALNLEDTAFLQYTSGSTGHPKGVMVTHGNLLSNTRLIERGFGHDQGLRGIIWLPAFHDMGLIGGILQPMALGAEVTLMSPLGFLRRPQRWLQAISRFRGTTSGGPDFAWRLCLQKVTDADLAGLDLSSWRVAFSGAEPIRVDTLRQFSERFASAGFRPEMFYPTYGLAEATLFVSGLRPMHPLVTTERDGAEHVGCGTEEAPVGIRIVDPATAAPVGGDGIGEIWISGPSVAAGYWGLPELSKDTFGAMTTDGQGPFLRTGDLGFFRDGHLFVTGRIKDLIIIRGRNLYPQDVEATVTAAHPAIRDYAVVAFGVAHDGAEGLAVVAEIENAGSTDMEAVIRDIRDAVIKEHGVAPATIAVIRRGQVPKTSSGKLQRRACRDALAAGSLEVLARADVGVFVAPNAQISTHPGTS